MALIELRDVRKIYRLGEVEVQALAGITLDIEQGDYAALIGASGSGKSTLMNTLGCLDRPTSGSYQLAGTEVTTLSLDARARLRNERIGFVFQNFNLLNRTSALENVELPLYYGKHLGPRTRRRRAAELLDRVGLSDRMHHHPAQLSGGQQQRVAIARALVNQPSIILADEPTGNLDSRTSAEIIRLFWELNQNEHITVILVTHDPEIARYTQRTIALKDGLVLKDDRSTPKPSDSTEPGRPADESSVGAG